MSALMADVAESEAVAAQGPEAAERMVPIEKIVPNPEQPRKRFAEPEEKPSWMSNMAPTATSGRPLRVSTATADPRRSKSAGSWAISRPI